MSANGITRIRGGQIKDRTIEGIKIAELALSNEHIAESAAIAESKLNIAWSDRYQDALETKKVVDYIQVNATSVSGSSVDVTDLGIVSDAVASTTSEGTTEGILVDSPKNRVIIRNSVTGDPVLDANDEEVYGRMTFDAENSAYVVNFYSGSDVAYTFATAVSIDWQYAQRFNLYSVSEMFAANEKFVEGAADATAHLNIEQLARDLYGSSFSLDRDGSANLGTSLADQISNEVSRAQQAESDLQDAIDLEVENRENAIIDLQNDLASTLVTSGATLVGVDGSSDLVGSTVQEVLENLESRMSAQEDGGGQEVTDTHTRDAASANGYFAVDTFTSLEDRLVDIETVVDAEVQSLVDALDAEELRATNAEAALQSELDATQTGAGLGANGTYSANGSANYISSASSLKDADNKLDVALKSEETARIAADNTLQDNIDAEEARALAAEGVLQDNIDAEETRALAAEGVLQDNIDAEEARALAAEGVLQDNIDAEEARALAAEGVLQDNIDAEELRATNAEAALQSELDATQTGAGLGANGTYSANGSANYISAATSLKDADNKLDTALKSEETARIAADNTLQDNIDAEEARALAAEEVLQDNIDAEETRALAAEGVLQDNIDTVVSNLASTANGEGASLIGIEDADGNFSTSTLEGVLAEIASNADSFATELASTATGEGASLIGVESGTGLEASTVQGVLVNHETRIEVLEAKAHEHKKAVINITSTMTTLNMPVGKYYVPGEGTLSLYINGIAQANGFNFDEVVDAQGRGTGFDFGSDELIDGDRIIVEYVEYQVDRYTV